MAKLRPVQNSFSAGEISPLLDMRSDTEGYKHGVREMLNMLPLPQGPCSSRTGFEFATELVGETYGRIFPVKVRFEQAYIIAITENFISVIDQQGATPSINYFQNPDFTLGSANWNPVAGGGASVDFPGSTCVLTSNNNQDALISQELTGRTASNLHQLNISMTGIEPVRILVQTADNLIGDISDEVFSGTSYTTTFTPGTGTFRVKVIKEQGDQLSKTLNTMTIFDAVIGPAIFPSPYTEHDIRELQYAQVPGQDMVYFVTRNVDPYFMSLFTSPDAWVWNTIPFDFGAASAPWGTDFPGSITFHDGRLWLGGSNVKPVTHWASAIDEANNTFTNFDPLFDSGTGDASTLDFTRSKDGSIRWLAASRELFSGTSVGEDLITSAAGAITVSDVNMERQSVRGSVRVQPQPLSDRLVFLDASAKVLYAMDFLDGRKGWSSIDVSFSSQHILNGGVTEISEIKTPVSGSLLTRRDGKLAVLIYDTIRDIVGWALVETDGQIISATVAETQGVSYYVILVKRTNGLFVEFLDSSVKPIVFLEPPAPSPFPLLADAMGVPRLDSAKKAASVNPTNVFSGFDHLIGETVGVMADGTIHRDVVVDPSGNVTLDDLYQQVIVGLHYTLRIRTLPQDAPDNTGSGRSKMNHWAKLYVRVKNSGEPLINGTRVATRQVSTGMGDADPLISGDIKVADLGTTRDGVVTIEQDLPLPLTIIGLFGEVGTTGL